MLHKPTVTLQVPDNRLASAGYVRRIYPHEQGVWENSTGDLYLWPFVQMITLPPLYPQAASEALLTSWTGEGAGASYQEISGVWGSSGAFVFQQNPDASDCLLTADFTPEDNQPFVLDFFLGAVNANDWYADFKFCRNYSLRLLYNGDMQVWANSAVGDDTPVWRCVDGMKTLKTLFNQHLRLWVYPTARQELLFIPEGAEGHAMRDPDPLIVEDPSTGQVIRTICDAAPPVLYVSSGVFTFGYRKMTFKQRGYVQLPMITLPWGYSDEFTLVGGLGDARAAHPYTADLSLIDDSGTLLSSPPDDPFQHCALLVEIDGAGGNYSPEVNWAELQIAPTSQPFVPTAIPLTGEGRLLSANTAGAARARRTIEANLSNLAGLDDGLYDNLHMGVQVVADTVTLGKGYVGEVASDWGQDGNKTIGLRGDDPLDRLDIPLSDSYIGDGRVHTAFVEELFKRAGLAAADYSIAVDPASMELPEAFGVEKPLFQSCDGKTIREMVEYIGKVWSGWELYCSRDGVIHYAPLTVGAVAKTLKGGEPIGAGQLKYFSVKRVRTDEDYFNYIVVIGQDPVGDPIFAVYYDEDSISNPAATNYLGYEKLLLLVDSNLRNSYQCETALGYLVAGHGIPLEEADLKADFDTGIDVGSVVGFSEFAGSWQIRQASRDWGAENPTMTMRVRRLP